ncbi:RyR domain protein [Ectopseudomonas oleovorans]|uniref:RyR domain protein n=1 Tax=Ectopseudomonas oleovorans TaxID=301 RepID=A0A653B0E5_ECTOL|nr:RyR domain protein [Pseudomonas oleovorans]
MKVLVIAKVAHAINAAYCLSIGDDSVPAWEEAGEQHHASLVAGVEMHLANPNATPEQSHESWLTQKVADGWVYGEEKDAEKKIHPCCRPYDELPPEQKSKDYLFRAVVHALKDLPDADEAVALALAKAVTASPAVSGMPTKAGHIAVKYIGRRPQWSDHLYGTGLTFDEGQVRNLPTGVARTLLRHCDLFKECKLVVSNEAAASDNTQALLEQGKQQQAKTEDRKEDFAVIDQVNQMQDKDALVSFAATRCNGLKLAKTQKVETMRAKIVEHINRFGASA